MDGLGAGWMEGLRRGGADGRDEAESVEGAKGGRG